MCVSWLTISSENDLSAEHLSRLGVSLSRLAIRRRGSGIGDQAFLKKNAAKDASRVSCAVHP